MIDRRGILLGGLKSKGSSGGLYGWIGCMCLHCCARGVYNAGCVFGPQSNFGAVWTTTAKPSCASALVFFVFRHHMSSEFADEL